MATNNNWRKSTPAGYTRSANVAVDYDAGYHATYGRILSCDTCGSAVMEGSHQKHDKWHAELGDWRLSTKQQLDHVVTAVKPADLN